MSDDDPGDPSDPVATPVAAGSDCGPPEATVVSEEIDDPVLTGVTTAGAVVDVVELTPLTAEARGPVPDWREADGRAGPLMPMAAPLPTTSSPTETARPARHNMTGGP